MKRPIMDRRRARKERRNRLGSPRASSSTGGDDMLIRGFAAAPEVARA